jgi:hypothetical protein
MPDQQHKGTEFSNISETWEQNESKRKDNASGTGESERGLGKDYWERVADDSASGYKDVKHTDPLLNEDQLSDDHIRGDADPDTGNTSNQ